MRISRTFHSSVELEDYNLRYFLWHDASYLKLTFVGERRITLDLLNILSLAFIVFFWQKFPS
jgi:hypothetical protein